MHKLLVGRADRRSFEPVDAVVDTGAFYTSLPASVLRRLGYRPITKERFILADGRRVTRPVGEVSVRLDGQTRTTLCVFAGRRSPPILGAFTLEAFGMSADPKRKRLVKARALLLL